MNDLPEFEKSYSTQRRCNYLKTAHNPDEMPQVFCGSIGLSLKVEGGEPLVHANCVIPNKFCTRLERDELEIVERAAQIRRSSLESEFPIPEDPLKAAAASLTRKIMDQL
jgi:hypothetical protein